MKKATLKSETAKNYNANATLASMCADWVHAYGAQGKALNAFIEKYIKSGNIADTEFRVKVSDKTRKIASTMPVSADPRDGYMTVREAVRYYVNSMCRSWNGSNAVKCTLDPVYDIVYVRRVTAFDLLCKTDMKKARGIK